MKHIRMTLLILLFVLAALEGRSEPAQAERGVQFIPVQIDYLEINETTNETWYIPIDEDGEFK